MHSFIHSYSFLDTYLGGMPRGDIGLPWLPGRLLLVRLPGLLPGRLPGAPCWDCRLRGRVALPGRDPRPPPPPMPEPEPEPEPEPALLIPWPATTSVPP